MTGRGWHGESGRHSKAARGIKTAASKPETRSVRSVLLAHRRMMALVGRIDRQLAWGTFADFSVSDYNYFVRDLEDVIAHLKKAKLSAPNARILTYAERELNRTWELPPGEIGVHLENIRENLHIISNRYLRKRGYDIGHRRGWYV